MRSIWSALAAHVETTSRIAVRPAKVYGERPTLRADVPHDDRLPRRGPDVAREGEPAIANGTRDSHRLIVRPATALYVADDLLEATLPLAVPPSPGDDWDEPTLVTRRPSNDQTASDAETARPAKTCSKITP